MKNSAINLVVFIGLFFANSALTKCQSNSKPALKHFVCIKYKDDVEPQQIEEINDSFDNLPKQIPAISDFERGLNDSPENHHQGFTHCYMFTFKSEEDRDKGYTLHPSHTKFVEKLSPLVDKIFVVDYWVN